MEIIYAILVLIVVGAFLYVIERYAPIDGLIKKIIYFVVIIAVLLWLLKYFGLMPGVRHL
jgi:hypothetical protein